MLMGKEGTIRSYISNYRHEDTTVDRLYLKDVENLKEKKIILPGEDIYAKYQADLQDLIELHEMTIEEKRRWLYNPKVMSYDLYNTTEYWSLLLQLNEVYSATQFNMNPVKMYSRNLPTYINRILNLERDIINENESEVTKIILNKN